jgi:hypothetical protein
MLFRNFIQKFIESGFLKSRVIWITKTFAEMFMASHFFLYENGCIVEVPVNLALNLRAL